jgi:hypothetical protein
MHWLRHRIHTRCINYLWDEWSTFDYRQRQYSSSFHHSTAFIHLHKIEKLIFTLRNTRGADKSLGFIKKTSYGIEKMYLLYIFPLSSSTRLWLRCSNFFNPSKKNSFGCAANRKIGKQEKPKTYRHPYIQPSMQLHRLLA